MKVVHKTWFRNYEAVEELEAGIVLNGAEAKSMIEGRVKLEAAYVKLKNGEAFIRNMEVFRYSYATIREYNPFRERKLLLNKKEIIRFETKMASQPSLTIIPVAVYKKGRHIKVKIVLARGRTDTEKRKLEKNKEVQRKQEKEAKEYMKR